MDSRSTRLRVVVAGASFAGLAVATALAAHAGVELTLVEPKGFVEYVPSLPEAGSRAGLDPAEFVVPLRDAVSHSPLRVVRGRLAGVDLAAGGSGSGGGGFGGGGGGIARVELVAPGAGAHTVGLAFDVLVVATGSSYAAPWKADADAPFASPAPPRGAPVVARASGRGVAADADAGDADALRAEAAAAEDDEVRARVEALLASQRAIASARRVVIVGGGPVGVEVAAEIAAARSGGDGGRVTLVTAAPSLLAGLPAALGVASAAWLEARGVRVVYGAKAFPIVAQAAVQQRQAAVQQRQQQQQGEDRSAGRSGVDASTGASLAPGTRVRIVRARAGVGSSGTSEAPPAAAAGAAAAEEEDEETEADLVLVCTGARPSSRCLLAAAPASDAARASSADAQQRPPAAAQGPLSACVLSDGSVAVDGGLCACCADTGERVSDRVFAIGDVATVLPMLRERGGVGAEPRLAHTSEKHAHFVVARVLAMMKQAQREADRGGRDVTSLEGPTYPTALTGVPTSPVIVIVSLGPRHAVVSWDRVTLVGPLAMRVASLLKRFVNATKLAAIGGGAFAKAFWGVADAVANFVHRWVTRHLAVDVWL